MDLMLIKMLNTAVERQLNKELAPLGITYTQAAVVGFIAKNPRDDLFQKDLEEGLGLTHPTMSSIVSRLEAKGLVDVSPLKQDRRYKRIALTPQSRALNGEIAKKIENIATLALDGIDPAAQEEFSRTLGAMTRNLNG